MEKYTRLVVGAARMDGVRGPVCLWVQYWFPSAKLTEGLSIPLAVAESDLILEGQEPIIETVKELTAKIAAKVPPEWFDERDVQKRLLIEITPFCCLERKVVL